MTYNRIHISTLALAIILLMITTLPFSGCHSGAQKTSSSKAVSLIDEAFKAKDNERLQYLADRAITGKAMPTTKWASANWQSPFGKRR